MPRWLIATAVICVAATGCSETPEGKTAPTARRLQQAGPTNPIVTAGHHVAAEAAQRAVQGHLEAMRTDMIRLHWPPPAYRPSQRAQ